MITSLNRDNSPVKAAVLCFLLACSAAFAQDEERPRRVGFLSHAAADDRAGREQLAEFARKLDELGFAPGRKAQIEARYAAGAYDRLPLLAAELVSADVEVIVTDGTPATSAARRATATVPIVAAHFAEPVASGFAVSLERPGRNVTGFTSMGSAVYERRLELLAEAVPGAARIGVLANPGREFFLRILPGLEATAKRLGRELVLAYARDAKGIEESFALLRTKRIGALLVSEHRALAAQSRLIAALAMKDRLPAAFSTARGAEEGGLIGCAADPKERYRSAAGYVARILRGEKVEELPILQPVELELVLNLRTAAALGLAVPDKLRYRAGRVIE
jgi:putative ABC transport system substrate-binding protein